MEILLIRHGQSEADLINVHEGRADFPLTELGRKQARNLAEYLKDYGAFDAIWSSTLRRASETAEIISEYIYCKIIYDNNLKERNNGILAGEPITKDNEDIYLKLKPYECIEKGETDIEFRARAEAILHKILASHKESDRIIIFTHGGMIEKLLHVLLKLSMIPNCYFYTSDTGIHHIEYTKSSLVIKTLNNISHLK